MTKRRLIQWSLILVTLAAFAVWLEPTRVVWGWLRGAAFYQGRPTSWWRDELPRWEHLPSLGWGRQANKLEQWWHNRPGMGRISEPPGILVGDPDAQLVLETLAEDSSEYVRSCAAEGLRAIQEKKRP